MAALPCFFCSFCLAVFFCSNYFAEWFLGWDRLRCKKGTGPSVNLRERVRPPVESRALILCPVSGPGLSRCSTVAVAAGRCFIVRWLRYWLLSYRLRGQVHMCSLAREAREEGAKEARRETTDSRLPRCSFLLSFSAHLPPIFLPSCSARHLCDHPLHVLAADLIRQEQTRRLLWCDYSALLNTAS